MRMKANKKLSLAAVLAAGAMLATACGGSGGLIPEGKAGPLRSDFEAVASAAENGHGNCSATRRALAKTRSDFEGLPSSVQAKLRETLSKGISHLEGQALELCRQPATTGATTTASTTPSKSTSTTTTTTTSTTSSEEEPVTTTSSSTSSTPPPAVGGAEAPSGGEGESNQGGNAAEGEAGK
jgi:hypothetical protein